MRSSMTSSCSEMHVGCRSGSIDAESKGGRHQLPAERLLEPCYTVIPNVTFHTHTRVFRDMNAATVREISRGQALLWGRLTHDGAPEKCARDDLGHRHLNILSSTHRTYELYQMILILQCMVCTRRKRNRSKISCASKLERGLSRKSFKM